MRSSRCEQRLVLYPIMIYKIGTTIVNYAHIRAYYCVHNPGPVLLLCLCVGVGAGVGVGAWVHMCIV